MMHIIPHSFFGAFADGEVLPVLLISIIVGFGLTRVGIAGEPVVKGIDSFSHVLFAAFGFIMKLAPMALSAPWPSRSASTASTPSARWVC